MGQRNHFTVRELVSQIRDQLRSELDPQTRSHLHRWLVEEMDKLGHDLELLAEVEEAIKDFDELIGTQMKIVAALERDGRHDRVARERALLDGLRESQILHHMYYEKMLAVFKRNQGPPTET